ncbi:MAG: phospholipase D-like domain-containing protein [Gammaproteobacteria bacterium]|nr:phospholipase D-like domain-containing protein [Gammaproteobacteria bacterium]
MNEQFELFREGDDLYDDMLAAIRSARDSVCLESYIFGADELGDAFVEALCDCATRGCRVRVSIDAIGSLGFAVSDGPEQLLNAGVELNWFNPPRFVSLQRLNRRNHRKLLVVDGEQAWLGGFNIHSECSRRLHGDGRWRDTQVRFGGQLARHAQQFFENIWAGNRRQVVVEPESSESIIISNHNWRQRHRYRRNLLNAVRQSQQRVWLTTPYFMPDRPTQLVMAAAAQRGVDVRLLVPYKTDRPMTQWAARAAYANLLAAGVRIFEYQPRLLHAKTALVDESWCTVGTANLDYRSFYVNFEMNLVSANFPLIKSLADDFRQDLEDAEEIIETRWSRRSIAMRVAEVIGWFARRYL